MVPEKIVPIFEATAFEQVGIVVADIDKSVETYWKTFGIGPWSNKTVTADMFTKAFYHGKPGKLNFKIARARKAGGLEIELLQPVKGENIYRDFLKEHGEGVHHWGWHKVYSKEAFDKDTKTLEAVGFPCLQSGLFKNTAFAYFDTTKAINTMLEMIWIDPAASPSTPPDLIYPEQ
jgi:hypothetical protein